MDVVILAIPNLTHNCFISEETNCDPWSLNNTLGRPVREKISTRASATETADISLRGTTSGYFEAKHIVVSKYL